jgi:hypothetical protein
VLGPGYPQTGVDNKPTHSSSWPINRRRRLNRVFSLRNPGRPIAHVHDNVLYHSLLDLANCKTFAAKFPTNDYSF